MRRTLACRSSAAKVFGAATACGFYPALWSPPAKCEQASIPLPPRGRLESLASKLPALLDESANWKRELVEKANGYQIEVRSSASATPTTKARRYRSDIHIYAELASRTSAAEIFRHITVFEIILGWSPNLAEGEVLARGDATTPHVVRFRTVPAAGGMISSREFIEARLCFETSERLLMVCARWDEEAGLPPTKGTTAAYPVDGSSYALVESQADGSLRVVTFSQSEIGGWLPVQIVNSACAGATMKSGQCMLAHLGFC